jgi:hypothetical protein
LPISKSASNIEGNYERLEERKYDAILFRNGHAKDAPEMLVEFRGLRRHGKGHSAYYAISLGESVPLPQLMTLLHACHPPLPATWTVEETAPCFIVRDHNGQALAFVYCEDEPGRRSTSC